MLMSITEIIKAGTAQAVKELYEHEVSSDNVNINVTRKEFDGDFSVVVFPYTKAARKKPEQIGAEVGEYLVGKYEDLKSFNVIKGFLNLEVSDKYWSAYRAEMAQKETFKKPLKKANLTMK